MGMGSFNTINLNCAGGFVDPHRKTRQQRQFYGLSDLFLNDPTDVDSRLSNMVFLAWRHVHCHLWCIFYLQLASCIVFIYLLVCLGMTVNVTNYSWHWMLETWMISFLFCLLDCLLYFDQKQKIPSYKQYHTLCILVKDLHEFYYYYFKYAPPPRDNSFWILPFGENILVICRYILLSFMI